MLPCPTSRPTAGGHRGLCTHPAGPATPGPSQPGLPVLGGAGRARHGARLLRHPQPQLGAGCPVPRPHSPVLRHRSAPPSPPASRPRGRGSRQVLPAQPGSRGGRFAGSALQEGVESSYFLPKCQLPAQGSQPQAAGSFLCCCCLRGARHGGAGTPVTLPTSASHSPCPRWAGGAEPPESPRVAGSQGWDPRDRCRSIKADVMNSLAPPVPLTPHWGTACARNTRVPLSSPQIPHPCSELVGAGVRWSQHRGLWCWERGVLPIVPLPVVSSMAGCGNTTCPPRAEVTGPIAELGVLATLGAKNGELALLQEQGNPTQGMMLPREKTAPHAGGDTPARDGCCPPNAWGGLRAGGAHSSAHTAGLWLYLPIDICCPGEEFFSPIQVFPSNHSCPETCVKEKPPKYPMKSQQNPLNPGAGT